MSNARDKANIPSLNFSSTGIDDNANATAITINSSEQVAFTDGTASLPSITNLGDENTGIFFPSADTIAFSEGGTEAMRITSDGRLGIGTTTPTEKLSVDGSVIFNESGNNVDFRVEGDTDANLLFVDASTDRVGIGNSSPSFKLDVKDGDVAIRETDSSVGSGIRLINDVATQIIFRGAGSTRTNPGATQGMPQLVSASGYDLFIGADGNNNIPFTTNRSERMRLTSDGKLGIGTSSPSAGLDVVSTNYPYIAEFRQANAGNPGAIVIDSPTDDGGRPSFLNFETGSVLKWGIGLGYNDSNRSFHISTSGLESGITGSKFTITPSGNVGIGTTSPSDTANRVTLELNDTWGGRIRNSSGGTANSEWSISTSSMALFGTIVSQPLAFTTNNLERMRINSDGAVSIASTNVTQNSHFNVRQDDNTHATRTYLQARVGSGALYSIKYLGTIPAVSLGTQLIIPFISQNSIGSKTYVHIRGMSCESNTTNPKAFDVKFSVGHTTTLSNLTVLQNLGTCTGASISGMNIVLAFSVDYTHSGDSGMFIEIDYIAHHQDASINLSGIVMN
jgi:hypothetical protein